MFNIDLGIKFGSNEIIIFRKGFGVIAKEPAYLAVVENGKNIKVKATGKQAEKLFYTSTSDITVYQPIVNSEIVDEKKAVVLISEILNKIITDKFLLKKLTAIVAVPCALTERQLLKIKRVLLQSGVNRVTFVQNGICARQNLEIDSHIHSMIVDIGKFSTDISVMNDFSFDFGRMYQIGGQDMDKSITSFIADNHDLEVSDMSSESIKNEIASLYERDLYKTDYIGINKEDKFVKQEITANEVRVAVVNVYNKIFDCIKQVLKLLPKEVVTEIYSNGIMFVGGGSKISGLYEYAKKKLEFPIIIEPNPEDSVINGVGKLLSADKEFLKISV